MKYAAILVCVLASPALVLPAWAQSVFKPEEAADHAGGTVTIEGIANVTATRSGAIFIDMGGSGKSSAFSAVIFAAKVGQFPQAQQMYNGKVVDVTGTVQIYQGKPEIILNSPNQITIKVAPPPG